MKSPNPTNRDRSSIVQVLKLLVLALVLGVCPQTYSQILSLRSQPLRFTVPVGVPSSNFASVTVVLANLTEPGNVTFAVTGAPAEASANFSTNSIASNGTHTASLVLTTTALLPPGTYDLAIEGSGDASFRLPITIICAHFWSGATFTGGGAANLNNAGNWARGMVPSTTDDVIFSNSGGVAANSGENTTNVVITANQEFGSVRFAQDGMSANRYYNIEYQNGARLLLTGPGGFSQLRDAKVPLASQAQDVRMFGPGALIVSNAAANFASLIDGQLNATLDLRELDYLYADVNRLPFGDYRAYPNFLTNGWVGSGTLNEVSRFAPQIWLAKTNVIKANYVDPHDYDDLGERNYALTIANYSRQGTTANLRFSLGNSNAFFLDSICFSQALQGGSGHNYNFISSNSVAIFRGIGGMGSRMSVFAISDSGSPALPGSANNRGQVNFANVANARIDALVDRLWLAVDRTNNSAQMTLQATLTFSNGVFDVNEAYLGYQRSGDNQGDATSTGFAGPEGTVNLQGSATLRVNGDLNLGYTTASAPGGNTSPERCFGRVIITTGTLMASNVVVGGVTKLSTNNVIVIGGGHLILTNDVGDAAAPLAALVSTNGSRWTLHGVTADHTNIFVKTLNAPAAGPKTRINIPSLSNVTSYPVTIPLISYVNASPVFNGLEFGTLPSGVVGISIVDDSINKVINFTFDTNQPKVLVWRGTEDNNWDTTTTNWIRQADNSPSKFTDGDSVVFDDTATGSTTINVVGTVVPGQTAAPNGIVVSNSTLNYTLGGGNIAGGATLRKVGPGTLTVDALATTAVELSGGTLAGTGNLGPTSVGFSTTMTDFLGAISGGLTASNGFVAVGGSVSGGLILQAGSLTNNGNISGPVTLSSGSVLDNVNTINVALPWNIPTNAVVINNGTILQTGANGAGQGLTVNGELRGTGRITQNGFQAPSDVRVTLGTTGRLIIGNTANEITNTTIAVRLDLLAGSISTFDVDNSAGVNDKINLTDGFIQGKVNFGAGNNLGGTLLVNRTAGPAFNMASSLNLFDLTSNNPDNASPAIPSVTPTPAPGLAWDLTQMLTNLTLLVTSPGTITNVITSTNIVFSWPATRLGWRLERQTNSLAVGIEPGGTNWQTVFLGLAGTNSLFYPDTNDLSMFYFRSVQPISQTNGTVFYRLAYP